MLINYFHLHNDYSCISEDKECVNSYKSSQVIWAYLLDGFELFLISKSFQGKDSSNS